MGTVEARARHESDRPGPGQNIIVDLESCVAVRWDLSCEPVKLPKSVPCQIRDSGVIVCLQILGRRHVMQ